MRVKFLEAGEIVTTHGVRGEMKIYPWSDDAEFLMGFQRVRISGKDYVVENCRVQKTCNLLKLQGIDSVESAQLLRGKIVEVYREDAAADVIFVSELIGVRVQNNGRDIGEISDVLDYPGNKVYVVVGEYTYMIPAVKEFILSTDIVSGIMQVRLIEGMRVDEN